MYIAAKLAVEMFFLKMGKVVLEEDRKCIQNNLKVGCSRVLIGRLTAPALLRQNQAFFNIYRDRGEGF